MSVCVRPAVFQDNCPECEQPNYWDVEPYDGDCTKGDFEGLKCWNCQHEWIFDECLDWITNIDSANMGFGREYI